jgi:hypothetical protein
MSERNGTWKKIVITGSLGILAWFAVDYLEMRTRATILETNYTNIMTLLDKIEKKIDKLDPDYGPSGR